MTFTELKTFFRTKEIPVEYKMQCELFIQSIEILMIKHSAGIKNHPHEIYCKQELIKIYQKIIEKN